jgi:hypothetical protein
MANGLSATDQVVLGALGTADIVYGFALATTSHDAVWWPASVGRLVGVSVHLWGALWLAVGVYLLIGVAVFYPQWRRRLFGTAATLKAVWAFVAVDYYWEVSPHLAVWGPAAIYLSFAVCVLALGWPQWRE